MGSGINQTNTNAGPVVASILLSNNARDDDGSHGRTNPSIVNDRLERSQLTFSPLGSGLHAFPWQSSYCPSSNFLDSGFSSSATQSTVQAMDIRRQTLYSLIDRGLTQRAMSLNYESLNQLHLERCNRLRFDSSTDSSTSRCSDIDTRAGFLVTDPRTGTSLPASLEPSNRLPSLPVGHLITKQALLDGKFHRDASKDNAPVNLAARGAHQEFMLQASQIPLCPTVARFAGVMSSSSNAIGGGPRIGGLEKIEYTHRVQRATTPMMPLKDGIPGGGYSTFSSGCAGPSPTSAVRKLQPEEYDIINYHSQSSSSRGLPVSFLQSDKDILSSPCSSSSSTRHAEVDHPLQAVQAASDPSDKKPSSPKSSSPQKDDSMESRRNMEEEDTTRSPRNNEAKSLMSAKRSKPRREGEAIPPTKRKRRRGENCKNGESASPCSTQIPKCRGKEEHKAPLREEENGSHEKRQRVDENPFVDSTGIDRAAGRGHHPQLRKRDEEQRNIHDGILANQESIQSRLLRIAAPILPFPYSGSSRYPYSTTRALLDNVTSALFPPMGSATLGSIGLLLGADSDQSFGSRIPQVLSSGEGQLPEETYSGAIERPYRDSNAPGQVYPSARDGSRDVARRGGRCFPLHISEDENNLSSYQVLARKQIEVFEASIEEAGTNAQGRNRQVQPGEIGIRCRHCARIPPKDRVTGAVYYPKKLDGVYQTAQKMAVNHLVDRCQEIPEETKQRLQQLKDTTRSSDGGGKKYWAEALRTLGVRELDSGGLVWNE